MSNSWLIAHKVRGEPAFDVAERMECPECGGKDENCEGCQGEGYWWIIPTSGHRAYPWWSKEFHKCAFEGFMSEVPDMPHDARDHYAVVEAKEPKFNTRPLLRMLGLGRSKDFTRRF